MAILLMINQVVDMHGFKQRKTEEKTFNIHIMLRHEKNLIWIILRDREGGQ